MTVVASSFREHFQEFAESERYPKSVIDYLILIATQLVDPGRWGTLADVGVELWVAHNLVLGRKAMDEAANSAPPGVSTGLVNNKSVDKVSVGYDTASSAEEGAGHWNLTIYGTRYIRLARMMGAGPIQVGVGVDPTGGLGSAAAWAGIWQSGFPNPS